MAKKTKKTEEITKKFGDERRKALDDALKNIEKDFGKGAVMRLGERAEQKVQVMSSGSLALDIALGAGGYPKGRIIEIYGPESSGKTTVALHAVAQTQKEGGIAAFIDAEHALDPAYAAALGVNIDELLLSQPDSGEQGLEIAGKLIDSGAVDLVVVDSVAALVPRAEIDGDIGDSHVYDLAATQNIPVLLEIPFDRAIASAYSRGQLLIDILPHWQEKFQDLFEKIKQMAMPGGGKA